jgi:hypothetical protein
LEITQKFRAVPAGGPAVAEEPFRPAVPSRPPGGPQSARGSVRGSVRGGGAGKGVLGAAAAALGIVVIGAGVAGLLQTGSPKRSAAAAGGAEPAAASPPGTPPGTPSGAALPGPALSKGRFVSYRTTQREPGYFEGVLTLTNPTGAPLNGWQMSFGYPGADVKNIWGGVLVQGGANPVIKGDPAAGPIPAGGTVQVRFGAAGRPSAPRGCTLNGKPC